MEAQSKTRDFRGELYDRYASRFKGAPEATSDRRWFLWAQYKILPLLGDLPRDTDVLDLGCGAGQMLQLLKDHGFTNVRGLDISPEQVELAVQRGLSAEVGDVFDHLNGSHSRFGLITAFDFVEHFGKPEQIPLFAAIHAALRPGGRLLLETPNGEGLFSGQVIYGDLTHLTIFNEGSLTQLLRLVGFEEIEFFETGPAPKDLKGKVRGLLWRVVKLAANSLRIVESGDTQRLWTKNLICCCRKSRC